MTEYRLGCLLCNDERKDEWFVQIVEPYEGGMFGFKVAATGMGIGKDETLKKVCGFVGLTEVPPIAMRTERTPHGVVHIGLTDAMRRCGMALDSLATDLALARHDLLTDGADQYAFDI